MIGVNAPPVGDRAAKRLFRVTNGHLTDQFGTRFEWPTPESGERVINMLMKNPDSAFVVEFDENGPVAEYSILLSVDSPPPRKLS